MVRPVIIWLIVGGCFSAAFAEPPGFGQALESILTADGSPANPGQFARDWQVLSEAQGNQIFELFVALDRAGPLAANWIRPALDAARARQGQTMSAHELQQFARNTEHGWRSRQLAMQELSSLFPEKSKELEAELIHDPVAEFRLPAIASLLQTAAQLDTAPEQKKLLLRKAWEASRDERQSLAIAKQLKELDIVVDPLQHFGWLTRWYVLGPFEDPKDEAYSTGFSPEQDVATALKPEMFLGEQWRHASYRHGDNEVAWQPFRITKERGELDFNELLGRLKGVAAYAAALVQSDADRDVEIRMRQQNSFKLWINGRLVMAQPVGHTGNSFDQYTFPAHLQQGANILLIKSVQIHPPMAHPFFETWHASARICDRTGGAIEGVNQPELPEESPSPSAQS